MNPYINLTNQDFQHMLSFAYQMQKLMSEPAYQGSRQSGTVATKKPQYESMLMGYDFHTQHGLPQLIEINNNAGGLYLPNKKDWLEQPNISTWHESIEQRLLAMFDENWRNIAILDEQPKQQFMYSEMQAYAHLLEDSGRNVFILDPSQLEKNEDGFLSYQGIRIDMIYNRHTDFYLTSPAMQHIRTAYMSDHVALNPHPQSYDLLGDKGRMVDWHRPHFLEQFLPASEVDTILQMIPMTQYVQDQNLQQLWTERKQWVFKPTASHAGKGVVLGKSITRKRFAEVNQPNMIMQAFVPPAKIVLDEVSYKYDVRLYMHGQHFVALAGRIYQGMLTNFRTEGSGFVPVHVI